MWLEDTNEKRKQAIMNYSSGENSFEFLNDEETTTFTISQGRYKTKIRKLAEKYPEECQIIAENKDGSIFGYIPTRWIKINPPMELSEERKEALRERARQINESKQQ